MAYTQNPLPERICQYWQEKEPKQCVYWDEDTTLCTYESEKVVAGTSVIERGDYYPYCNYIGTFIKCSKYTSSVEDDTPTTEARCILPDPYRHVAKSPNCGKWIQPTTTSGLPDTLDYSPINGYRAGKCDSLIEGNGGTDITCSGFNAGHLNIGAKPILESCTLSGIDVIWEESLPKIYNIMNKRSQIGRCKWWKEAEYEYSIAGDHTKGETHVSAPTWHCTHPSTEIQTNFSDFYLDEDNKFYRPPCNGAMPECPKYTGNIISSGFVPYLSNIYMRNGDKVLAEQILELRYNLRKERWVLEEYTEYFGEDSKIYAHEGTAPEIIFDNDYNVIDYSVVSMKVEISDFDCFNMAKEQVLLQKGTMIDNYARDFDTLIKEIDQLVLEPIIRSTFDEDPNSSTLKDKSYIFETPYSEHEEIMLVGDHFSNDADIVAINISDPDIDFIWPQLFNYTSMYDFKNIYSGSTDLYDQVMAHLKCYFDLLKELSPEKIYSNELPNDSRAFSIGAKTLFGDNKLMVFDLSDDNFGFSTIRIKKVFVGGVVAQTGFKVSTGDATVSDTWDYELTTCHPLFNPEISFEFHSLSSDNSSALPLWTYVDTKETALTSPLSSALPTLTVGYRMYKVKVLDNLIISKCDTDTNSSIRFLGNNGYILLVIGDDKKLHSVIRKWDDGNVDESGNSTEFKITLKGSDLEGNDHSIALEIMEYGTDRMENNQMLLKPKNADEYVRLYGETIAFEGLYVYERYSYGELPEEDEYEEIADGWSEEQPVVRANTEISGEGTYTITTPPIAPITMAVMFKGSLTGRIRGQAKSELVVWVKQPQCGDVEINYTWKANYENYVLTPTHYCFADESMGSEYTGTVIGGYSPMCGDHNFGTFSQRPATMWYPYDACDEYASYDIQTKTEYDKAPMEIWLNENGSYDAATTDHDSMDLRMLGPSDNYGKVIDFHTSIWACSCDVTYENSYKTGNNWFDGWARIRIGVSAEDMYYITRNGGQEPKFGNPHRGYLFSFRSTAALTYYAVDSGGNISVEKKWLPAYEAFSDLSFGTEFKEYPWNHYFNTDDNICLYLNQLGLSKVVGDIDNINIDEELVLGDEGLARYAFNEIFEPHYTTVGTRYPEPRKQYYKGEQLKPVTAWLTYKDYGDTSQAIQWAWREKWRAMERNPFDFRTIARTIISSFDGTVKDEICDGSEYHMTYVSFIHLMYPNYTYDLLINEHRRVTEEGSHYINWEASTYDPEDPKPTYFILRLDNGPVRVFGPKCNLIDTFEDIEEGIEFESIDMEDLKKHMDFYGYCSGGDWLNSVSAATDLETQLDVLEDLPGVDTDFMLYDNTTAVAETEEQAKETAIADEREVYTTDGGGEDVYQYYNRGLVFGVKESMLTYLPREDVHVLPKTTPYEFSLDKPANDDSNYSQLEPGVFYPATTDFGMVYKADTEGIMTMIFKFNLPILLSTIHFVFNAGLDEDVEDEDVEGAVTFVTRNYYNNPEIVISYSEDGESYTELITLDFALGEEEINFSIIEADVYNHELLDKLYSYVKFNVRYMPTEEELLDQETAVTQDDPLVVEKYHFMELLSVNLYRPSFLNVSEEITTYERKFNISVGNYGTYPTHGFESVGSLLYPNPYELSTIYQFDNSTGMYGMPDSAGQFTSGSKLRNRVCFECREDKELLEGTYAEFEQEQKKLYDEASLAGSDTIKLESIVKESLSPALDKTSVVTFPEWTTTLSNSLMLPLKEVEPKDLYSPAGHLWQHDTSSIRDFYNCGGGGKRKTKKIFDYIWARVVDHYGHIYIPDVLFDIYPYGGYEGHNLLTGLANSSNELADKTS